MRWLFLSHLSSKWCPYCIWGGIPLRSRALEAFIINLSFCKKIGDLTLSHLCRKYTTTSPFVAQSKAALNVSGDKLLGDTSWGKLPAAVCVGGLLVCVDISPCFPCFWAVKQEEEEEIFWFIYPVFPLFVLGVIPPLVFSCFVRSTPPSSSFAFFREKVLPAFDHFWCLF